MDECLGCKLANGIEPAQVVYEDDVITCLLDIAPINEGHVLILPKDHYQDLNELDEWNAQAIMKASISITEAFIKLYNPDGVTIIQNNGKFNDLKHYHMHVFPRYESDGFGWVETINNGTSGESNKGRENLEMTKNLLKDIINKK